MTWFLAVKVAYDQMHDSKQIFGAATGWHLTLICLAYYCCKLQGLDALVRFGWFDCVMVMACCSRFVGKLDAGFIVHIACLLCL